MTDTANPRAASGDNNPPETPFEIHQSKINDLYDEAALWLDGEPVDSEKMAEGIAKLLSEIRKANSEKNKAFREEKDPLVAASKECDDLWRPLGVLADRATAAAKQALAPWLAKKEREKAEADRIAREEADRLKREAEEAIQQTDATNLVARAEAEELVKDAKKADVAANKQARQSHGVKVAGGRTISSKTVWDTVLVDPEAALEHYWPHVAIEEALTEIAKVGVNSGKREIPGFRITERKVTI